jgi:hypothetical protein
MGEEFGVGHGGLSGGWLAIRAATPPTRRQRLCPPERPLEKPKTSSQLSSVQAGTAAQT